MLAGSGGAVSDAALEVPRVIFLGGSGRSGSTLIERLLGELPLVCNVGEVVHLWERGLLRGESCGCGEPLPACPFWTRVGEIAFGGWDRFDLARFLQVKQSVDRNRYIPALAAARPAATAGLSARAAWYASRYARLYAAIAQVSGCPVVVDSSKHASLAFCLRASGQIDLRVLQVVRDSRAVAYSWTKQMRRPEAADGGGQYMVTYSPAKSALLWDALNLGFGLLAARGGQVLRIRYEDFVAEPRETMTRLADFACGATDRTGALDRFLGPDGAKLSPSHTASGNPMRFATGSIKLRADEAWRDALPATDRAVVTALTMPLLAWYGYLGWPPGRPAPTRPGGRVRPRGRAGAGR